MKRRVIVAALIAGLVACATTEETPVAEPAEGRPLASSIVAAVSSDSVVLTLSVTNASESDVSLDFRSGQRYDFVVRTPSGEEIWRWSDGRTFMQALGSEVLMPGETLTYSVMWESGGRAGAYVAEGVLPATNLPVERRTEFELPG